MWSTSATAEKRADFHERSPSAVRRLPWRSPAGRSGEGFLILRSRKAASRRTRKPSCAAIWSSPSCFETAPAEPPQHEGEDCRPSPDRFGERRAPPSPAADSRLTHARPPGRASRPARSRLTEGALNLKRLRRGLFLCAALAIQDDSKRRDARSPPFWGAARDERMTDGPTCRSEQTYRPF
jgi:hypothetical protein